MTTVAGPHRSDARCDAVYQGSDPVVQASGDDVNEDKASHHIVTTAANVERP